jgi:ubiquitin carboxyl-terminal hydrolase L3
MFSKLATFLGVEEYAVNEVLGFDPELLAMLPQPCMAAIGCYMRTPEKKAEDKARGDTSFDCPYYMDQSGTLDNACGIIALMHAVLNNTNINLKEGSPLAHFRDAHQNSTAAERCSALETSTEIHDFYKTIQSEGVGPLDGSHARVDTEGNEIEGIPTKTFHFVAYVKMGNDLVEFDGTKAGPWVCKEGVDELMPAVGEEVKRRIAEGEIDQTEAAVLAIGPPMQW